MRAANLLFPIYPILLISVLAFTVSCNGQNTLENTRRELKHENQNSPLITGDTLTELKDSGMLIVFQDKNNNYWFAGATEGVYKYDGENLVLFTLKDGLCSHRVGIQ
jgi:hypothetical protein